MKNKTLLMDIVRQISRKKKNKTMKCCLNHVVPVYNSECAVVDILHKRKGAYTKDVDFV